MTRDTASDHALEHDPLEPVPWHVRLRSQGRTITWLADRLGVQRTYLSAIASGAKNPSHALLARIEDELAPRRLDAAGEYASGRALLVDLRAQLAVVLGSQVTELAPDEVDEVADDLARAAVRTLAGYLAGLASG